MCSAAILASSVVGGAPEHDVVDPQDAAASPLTALPTTDRTHPSAPKAAEVGEVGEVGEKVAR